jgi:invasion protein IalB
VRISFTPFAHAFVGLVALSSVAFAQDTKANPDEGSTGFGPRAGVQAQPGEQAAPEAPQTETIATRGAWSVQCTEVPGGKGAKTCGMIQNTKSDKNENVAISIVVSRVKRDGKAATFMRILAPIGVYLPTGIPVEIDGAALPNRMQFSRCLPRICEAFGEASPESLAKFKKGTAAVFYLYDRPGNSFPMKVSLEGFGAGLADLDKL